MTKEQADAKKRIMNTMIKLLSEEQDIHKITTRQIAQLAKVNSALINYYYQSKENLVNMAVSISMQSMANKMFDKEMMDQDPVDRLKNMFKAIAALAFKNYYLSEIALSSELKNGSISTSSMILPLLAEIYPDKKQETELRLIALQLIVPMQVLFLNAKDYKGFLSTDIFDDQQRSQLMDVMVDNILKERKAV